MSVTISKNYYKDNQDPLILIATKIGIESFFYDTFFKTDTNRIVYSTTDFALQKRSSNSVWNNSLLPFMNYRETSLEPENDRSWESFRNLKHGVYIDSLGMKVRFTPVTLNFDSTMWFSSERDLNIAFQKLIDVSSAETNINFDININGIPIQLNGLFDLTGLEYKPGFEENDWLLSNKVSTIKTDFKIQTLLPMIDKQPKYSLTEKVILKFGTLIDAEGNLEEQYEAILNHFGESISDFEKVV